MTHTTKLLIGVGIVGVAYYLMYVKPAKKTTAGFAKKERWVVGAYSNGYTYVYPEGNFAGGHYVQGQVNASQGTLYYPN